MKGAPGLIVAAMLGLLGVAMNWLYLQNKVAQIENISFLGIREGNKINAGVGFQSSDFVEVKIPKNNAKGLEDFVYLFKDRDLVVGTRATRPYQGGELFWIADYQTPPSELKLDRGKKEMLWCVPVDSSSFVSDVVNPGDKIVFLIPKVQGPTQAMRGPDREPSEDPAVPTPTVMNASAGELVGPFTVATVGNRLGSLVVAKANQNAVTGGNVIGIIAYNRGTDDEIKLDEKSARLAALQGANPNMKARVFLLPRTPKN